MQLVAALLEGSNTVISPGPGSASTATIAESFVLPFQMPAGTSDTNIRLGMLTSPKAIAVWSSAAGVSFKIYSTDNDAHGCNPFAFLSEKDTGLTNVSEIWVTNAGSQAATVTVMAAE